MLLLQAVWRGHAVRMRCSAARQEARRRLQRIAAEAAQAKATAEAAAAAATAAAAAKAALPAQAAASGLPGAAPVNAAGTSSRVSMKAAAPMHGLPPRSIGARAREALEVLLSGKHLSQVLNAVQVIELATRYSSSVCALIAESGGVGALLRFVRGCNRSPPHMEVLQTALVILANICR